MSIKTLTEQILNKIPTIGKWQRKFIIHLFTLWFSIRGRYNYINIARYGEYIEDTYRKNASRCFPFLKFNRLLVEQFFSAECLIAFDPTYISKSGKHTLGVGYYYSGCAGREKWGLEFSGIAAVDLKIKKALHLEAVQTVRDSNNLEKETLLEYYARQLTDRKEQLKLVSNLIAADSFFARAPFVEPITKAGFHLVTRLQKNIYMRYLYKGPRRKGRGRPKQYDGKVNPNDLRENEFNVFDQSEDGSWIAYHAIVNIRSWKRSASVVIVNHLDKKGVVKSYKIFACTDIEMLGSQVKHNYEARYQIEFLFRDAKQEAGLEHCQARSKEKNHFHVNTALTCVSLAKAAYYLTIPEEQRKAFSIADIKTVYSNQLFFDRIISWFGFSPNLKLINSVRQKVLKFAKRAA